jgi:RHS repeat-associated protein
MDDRLLVTVCSWMRSGIFIGASVFGVLLASPADAAVGRTAGNFQVISSGAATYTIPIFTPPGPKGVQPSIALVYNSTALSGTIGRGWSLSGFSSITSCQKTFAQDGDVYWTEAHYCLDGNRLRLVSGSGNYSVWATELADFSRINYNDGTYWTVERKDGLTYTYGGTSDSLLGNPYLTEWKIKEIRDRSGNKVKFTWKEQDSTTTGTTHPVKVEWTQTSASSGSYVYSMDFNYSAGANAPPSSPDGFVTGSKYKETDLLTSISVSVSGAVKRKYVLTYENSPTSGAKRLTQVKECSDSGATDCLSPTTITYQNGTAGVNTSSPALSISGVGAAIGDYDLNGDGILDILYYKSGSWYMRLGSANSGYGSEINTGLAYFYGAGKLLGNTADQLLVLSGSDWCVYSWNGSSFTSSGTGLGTWTLPWVNAIADLDADGRAELVNFNYASVANGADGFYAYMAVAVYRNLSTGGSPSFASPVVSTTYLNPYVYVSDPWPYGYELTLNITSASFVPAKSDLGDGTLAATVSVAADWGYWSPWDPWGATWSGSVNVTDVVHFNSSLTTDMDYFGWSGVPTHLADRDFNTDGCGDYFTLWGAALANCTGSYSEFVDVSSYGDFREVFDWDGDRKPELFQSDGSTLWVQKYSGGVLGTAVSTGLPGSCYPMHTDGNGDDLDDLVCLNLTTGDLVVYNHNGAATPADLAVQFKDGYDVTHNVTYTPIAHGSYTANTTATHPERDVVRGHTVVASAEATDGIGGTFTTTYTYQGATENVTGRGFQGFEKIEAVDSRNGIKHVQKYSHVFPYSGMLTEDAVYQSDNTLISKMTVTPDKYTLDATSHNERYFPYPSSSTTDVYEVGGARNGDWITRTTVSNTFDTSGNQTGVATVVTDKDAYSPLYGEYWTTTTSQTIYPNSTYWCLNLPSAMTVTKSSSVYGEETVSQATGFSPDYVNCRQDAESVGSGALQVDTTYTYGDAFGNVTGVSVTGRNPNNSSMTARASSISWGTTGQFPVSVTNALSQTTARTFHSTFGSLLTETDPNGIVVANSTYDSFGRISRQDRPDGTYSTYGYYASGGYYNPLSVDYIQQGTFDSGGVAIRYEHIFRDKFGRMVNEYHNPSDGPDNWANSRSYDSLGRVSTEGSPFFASTGAQYTPTHATTFSYDLLGRITQQSRPQSQSVSTPVTTTFVYAGRTQTSTDPQSKVTTKVFDVIGQMRRSQDHNGYYQSFTYDSAGSLKEVTDSLSNTLFSATYSYGIKPFQAATTDMDLGTWSYTYNSLGELVTWTDAKSQSFSQTYDALSRMTSRTEAEGTAYFTFGTSAGSHNIGQLANVSMSGYSEDLYYDSVGRLSTRSITTDQTYDIDFAYTNQGLIDTVTYPTSTASTRVKVKYGYAYGILKSVTDWTSGSAGTVYWVANTKNPRGQTTQETLGNGVVTNRSFDAVTGWLSSIQSSVGGGTALQNQSYLYDLVGNVTQRQESTQGLTENFYYDNLYRLDYSQLNSTTNLDLSYDAMGNITSRSDVNGNATWTYHSAKKHAVATTGSGGSSYSYDANGNMTSRAGSTITWSSYNYATGLATSTESTAFYYGPDRQYYKQVYTGTSGTETTHYVGGLLEKVYDGSVTDWRHSIVAEGQVVAIVSRKSTSANAVYYPLEDNQGSGSVLTNSSGTNLVRQSYNAFGLPRDGADWDGAVPSGDKTTISGISRRGYTGHSMLGDMGLIHMNGRVQDAITARFLSADPNIPNPGYTQSYNRYAYVNNNPLSFIDPSGFIPLLDEAHVTAPGVCDRARSARFCNGDAAAGNPYFTCDEICRWSRGLSIASFYDVQPTDSETPTRLVTAKVKPDPIQKPAAELKNTPQSQQTQRLTQNGQCGAGMTPVPLNNAAPVDPTIVCMTDKEIASTAKKVLDTSAILAVGGELLAYKSLAEALGPAGNIFGRTRLGGSSAFEVNSNSVLRIGWGWEGTSTAGVDTFRLSGTLIERFVESGHIDLPWLTRLLR